MKKKNISRFTGFTLILLAFCPAFALAKVHHIIVNINQPSFLPNAGYNITLCPGSGDTLHASGGISYTWGPDTTGLSCKNCQNPYAHPSKTTTYIVTVTGDHGCSGTDTIIVRVDSIITANAGTDVSVSKGDSVQLHAEGGKIYTWTPPTGLSNPNIPDPKASPTVTTTYTVTVSGGSECVSDKDSVKVTVGTAGVQSETISQMAAGFVTLFPNPNNGTFTFSFDADQKANYDIELRDVLGRLIHQEHLEKFNGHYSNRFDVAFYPKGFYSLSLRNGKEIMVRKVITY